MRGRTARLFALLCVAMVSRVATADTLLIRGDLVYTLAGPPRENAVVVIQDGRIVAVEATEESAAREAATTLRARVVTPGLNDAHTSIGLAGASNIAADNDANESGSESPAALRAVDAWNPAGPLVAHLLAEGITLVQAGPGAGSPIGGQAGLFRTHGQTIEAMVVRAPSAVVFALGEPPKRDDRDGTRGPRTRMGTAAAIRTALLGAARYAERRQAAKNEAPARDLGEEVLARVAAGDLPAVFVAQRTDDLATAIRIAEELGLWAALAGAAEAYLIAGEIARASVPVLLGPVMERAGAPEVQNATYEAAAVLARAGVDFAIRGGHEPYVPRARIVRYEAALAAANGLGAERALRAITLDAARLLGVDDLYGSLEPGKVADFVLYDGDPFEYTTHVEAVIGGRVIAFRAGRAANGAQPLEPFARAPGRGLHDGPKHARAVRQSYVSPPATRGCRAQRRHAV
jgi:imidazolonepropionase-like amidohydrolase